MKLTYPACFYPDEERKGAFAVVVPDLPGCVSGGDTLAEAILMGTDAASGWVLDELDPFAFLNCHPSAKIIFSISRNLIL